MVLKIIAEHGTHYKDGVFNVALWTEQKIAKYVGEPPWGVYTTKDTDPNCVYVVEVNLEFGDTVIPYVWPTEGFKGLNDQRELPVRHISYHNSKGVSGEQEELYISGDCAVYLMTDEGKTIERLI